MRTIVLFLLIILPCLTSAMFNFRGRFRRNFRGLGRRQPRRSGRFVSFQDPSERDTYWESHNGNYHQVEGYDVQTDWRGRPRIVANLESPDYPDRNVVIGGRRGRGSYMTYGDGYGY